MSNSEPSLTLKESGGGAPDKNVLGAPNGAFEAQTMVRRMKTYTIVEAELKALWASALATTILLFLRVCCSPWSERTNIEYQSSIVDFAAGYVFIQPSGRLHRRRRSFSFGDTCLVLWLFVRERYSQYFARRALDLLSNLKSQSYSRGLLE
jgi:hypothetical protein